MLKGGARQKSLRTTDLEPLYLKKSNQKSCSPHRVTQETTIFFYLWLLIYIDNFRVILKIDDAALSRPRPNQCTRRNAQVRLG